MKALLHHFFGGWGVGEEGREVTGGFNLCASQLCTGQIEASTPPLGI